MRNVAILGASGAIGAALAARYADRWTTLFLAGRSDRLEETAELCRQKGARVITSSFDARDQGALLSWCREITQAPLHLLFVASGVSVGLEEQAGKALPEVTTDLKREIEVNAVVPMLAANAVIRETLLRRTEPTPLLQVVLISSIAALTGLPSSPGYSATKAALRTYAESLRRAFKNQGIAVTCVVPGFVTSPMSQRYLGKKPLEITAEKAAEIIAAGVSLNKKEVVFPKRLALATRLLALVPECWEGYFLAPFTFRVAPDRDVKEKPNGAEGGIPESTEPASTKEATKTEGAEKPNTGRPS